MGAGPWQPVGVEWAGGRRSRLPSSGLQRTFLSGEAGGRVAERCTIGWATRAGGGVLALPFSSPRNLTLGGGTDVGGESGVGVGVDDCAAGGAIAKVGMGVSVDEVGAWLVDGG